MNFRGRRRGRWLIGAFAAIGLITFGPPLLVEHTSTFNATTREEAYFRIECKGGYSCTPSGQDWGLFNITTSTPEALVPVVVTHERTSYTLPSGEFNEMFFRLSGPTLKVAVMDTQGALLDVKDIDLGQVFPNQTSAAPYMTTFSLGTDVLDIPQAISRARLTVSLLVTFAFLLVTLLLSRYHIREYVGKSDSPPTPFLYLAGLGALLVPSSEQDEFVATWIAEIAEAEGWERVRFAADLLRVGPRIHNDMMLTQLRDRLIPSSREK